MAFNDDSPKPLVELYHLSLNENKPDSIMLLHSLMSSHREWAKISADLSDYHLLIPDLPGHRSSLERSSRDNSPFTLSNASEMVASLIRRHAHGGKCHVVGFSGGGFVGVELAHRYPELVRSLFVSGVYNMASKKRLFTIAQYLAVPVQTIQSSLPMSITRYLSGLDIPESMIEDMRINTSYKLAREGFAAMLELGEGYSLKVRTLAVAGAKQDDGEGTRKLGEMLKEGNKESYAVRIKDGMHTWGIQWPGLFADSVKAWVEGRELPEELRSMGQDPA
jgi:pimeloyl-ACP methyl ester carboxylesterase